MPSNIKEKSRFLITLTDKLRNADEKLNIFIDFLTDKTV